jgi:hypothetical protein
MTAAGFGIYGRVRIQAPPEEPFGRDPAAAETRFQAMISYLAASHPKGRTTFILDPVFSFPYSFYIKKQLPFEYVIKVDALAKSPSTARGRLSPGLG